MFGIMLPAADGSLVYGLRHVLIGWRADHFFAGVLVEFQDFVVPGQIKTEYGTVIDAFNFGAAHPGAFNAAFGDGSVHTINYDVDPVLFDRLGDRRDGEAVDLSQISG
jgi:prepilin-type processing-associated H-X9-DG protein